MLAAIDAEKRVGRASAEQTGKERDDPDPTPSRFGANKYYCDQ